MDGGFSLEYTSQTESQVNISWVLRVFHAHTDKDFVQDVTHLYMLEHTNQAFHDVRLWRTVLRIVEGPDRIERADFVYK